MYIKLNNGLYRIMDDDKLYRTCRPCLKIKCTVNCKLP